MYIMYVYEEVRQARILDNMHPGRRLSTFAREATESGNAYAAASMVDVESGQSAAAANGGQLLRLLSQATITTIDNLWPPESEHRLL